MFWNRLVTTPIQKKSRQRRKSKLQLNLEPLEDRVVPATLIVDTTADNLTGGDGLTTLREAIVEANADAGADTIKFSPAAFGTINLDASLGQLTITDDLTIQGAGNNKVTVSGQDAVRVFAVLPSDPTDLGTAPTVSIRKLTITNGLAQDAPGFPAANGFGWGGGLYNLGGTVHLDQVKLTNNQANAAALAAGGAVANEFGGTLTVSRSHFANNTSTGFFIGVGGAITSDLGPTDNTGGTTGTPTLEIDRSSFVGNTAQALVGFVTIPGIFPLGGLAGGGAVLNATGELVVSRSHFRNNTALGGAGTDAVDGTPQAQGGESFGGAIFSVDFSPFAPAGSGNATLQLSRSSFSGNSAIGGKGADDGGNGGDAFGGGVVVGARSIGSLHQNSFRDNTVTGGAGGGTSGVGGNGTGGGVAVLAGAFAELDYNRYYSNEALGGDGTSTGDRGDGRGGGLGVSEINTLGFQGLVPSAEVFRGVYIGNEAGGLGGGIYNEGELTVDRSSLIRNKAMGSTDQIINFSVAANAPGSASGGGVSNFGELTVKRSVFNYNEAIGADGATSPLGAFPTLAIPGIALGGGLSNNGSATIEGSRFTGNVAKAGDRTVGDFAGLASGGGIYNDANMIVTGSRFQRNRAIAGDEGTSAFHNGHALGGGIGSGSLIPAVDPTSAGASLVVKRSQFYHNQAIGGNENTVLFDVSQIPPADGPNNAYGGGILVYQGTADLDRIRVIGNKAIAGDGGAEKNGSIAAGGGLFFFSFLGSVQGTLTNSMIALNSAIGGNGLDGGDGGDALGGGIAAGSLGSPFGAPGTLTIDNTSVWGNRAKGGSGDGAGAGGDGLGGGIYNGSDSTLDLLNSFVFVNQALGAPGGNGIGGGIHNLGVLDFFTSLIFANFASTSDDNCFGC